MKYHFDKEQHLHTLGGKPLTGTSSVIDVLAKPLTWWASGLAVAEFGWLNPKKHTEEERKIESTMALEQIQKMSQEEYQKLLDKAYRAHASTLKDKAKTGTDLHAELEHWVKAIMGINPMRANYDPKIKPFQEWAEKNVDEFLFSEAHTYSERLWIGGIVDAGAKLKDGSIAIIDFKSSKEAYKNQFIQAGGYAIQAEEQGVFDEKGEKNKKLDGLITKLIIVPFGADPVLPVVMSGVQEYKDGFEAAVKLYRLLINYNE